MSATILMSTPSSSSSSTTTMEKRPTAKKKRVAASSMYAEKNLYENQIIKTRAPVEGALERDVLSAHSMIQIIAFVYVVIWVVWLWISVAGFNWANGYPGIGRSTPSETPGPKFDQSFNYFRVFVGIRVLFLILPFIALTSLALPDDTSIRSTAMDLMVPFLVVRFIVFISQGFLWFRWSNGLSEPQWTQNAINSDDWCCVFGPFAPGYCPNSIQCPTLTDSSTLTTNMRFDVDFWTNILFAFIEYWIISKLNIFAYLRRRMFSS